jgi:hypothetical protein
VPNNLNQWFDTRDQAVEAYAAARRRGYVISPLFGSRYSSLSPVKSWLSIDLRYVAIVRSTRERRKDRVQFIKTSFVQHGVDADSHLTWLVEYE